MYDELQSASVKSNGNNLETVTTLNNANLLSTSNFEMIGDYSSWTSNSSSTFRSHKQYVYFNELSNVMAVSIRTYCDNINTIYENDDSITETFVYTFEIHLMQDDYEHEYNIANIAGVSYYDFPLVNGSPVYGIIGDLFVDAITLLDVYQSIPASIISNVFGLIADAAMGSIELSTSFTHSYIKVRFGSADNHNFDEITTGLPVCFLLSKNEPGYIGNSKLIAVTAITYKTSVLNANTLQADIFYTTSPSLTKNYTVTLG